MSEGGSADKGINEQGTSEVLDRIFAVIESRRHGNPDTSHTARLFHKGTRKIAQKANDTFIEPQLKLHLDYLEGELSKAEWFAGTDFSAADIQMSFPLEAARQRAGLDESRPRLMSFLQRIHARPAYIRALDRGGKYDLLK